MSVIYDDEFGKITVRRNIKSSRVQIKLSNNGALTASLPKYAPLFLVKRLIKDSRSEIRELIKRQKPKTKFFNGMKIGKSHYLVINYQLNGKFRIEKDDQKISIYCKSETNLSDAYYYDKIKKVIIEVLESEAKSYLTARVAYLAEKYNFKYGKVRFSKASSRWGSCSSNGTISLNIFLMQLPFELIDYIIIHELAHTKQMNHGHDFWDIVEKINPNYKKHRKTLKSHSPSI